MLEACLRLAEDVFFQSAHTANDLGLRSKRNGFASKLSSFRRVPIDMHFCTAGREWVRRELGAQGTRVQDCRCSLSASAVSPVLLLKQTVKP